MLTADQPVPVWIQSHPGTDATWARALRGVLLREGFQPREEPADSSRFGILCFDKCDPGLLEKIERYGGAFGDRVLAIATSVQALEGGMLWKLRRAGAADVLAWSPEQSASEIIARLRRWTEIDRLLESPLVGEKLAGQSPAWRAVLRQIVEVAHFTDSSVLLTGESGTGKEMAARLVHELDPRPNKRAFVVLDCTTVVPELSGSEFFGHERGAFTNAVNAREGAFALADGGTLFLDEVGELPVPLQAELLRVIQEGTYKRVGSGLWQKTNFRLICATNRDLAFEQERGAFRRDFYHRIAAWTCHLPALRDRREDILPLAEHFFRQFFDGELPPIDSSIRDFFLLRNYPGNVRELKQLAARIARRHVGSGPITVGAIPDDECRTLGDALEAGWQDAAFHRAIQQALTMGVSLKDIGNGAVELAIRIALETEGGNLQRAARRLGVTDRALQMRRAAGRSRGKDGTGAVEIEPSAPASGI